MSILLKEVAHSQSLRRYDVVQCERETLYAVLQRLGNQCWAAVPSNITSAQQQYMHMLQLQVPQGPERVVAGIGDHQELVRVWASTYAFLINLLRKSREFFLFRASPRTKEQLNLTFSELAHARL